MLEPNMYNVHYERKYVDDKVLHMMLTGANFYISFNVSFIAKLFASESKIEFSTSVLDAYLNSYKTEIFPDVYNDSGTYFQYSTIECEHLELMHQFQKYCYEMLGTLTSSRTFQLEFHNSLPSGDIDV